MFSSLLMPNYSIEIIIENKNQKVDFEAVVHVPSLAVQSQVLCTRRQKKPSKTQNKTTYKMREQAICIEGCHFILHSFMVLSPFGTVNIQLKQVF